METLKLGNMEQLEIKGLNGIEIIIQFTNNKSSDTQKRSTPMKKKTSNKKIRTAGTLTSVESTSTISELSAAPQKKSRSRKTKVMDKEESTMKQAVKDGAHETVNHFSELVNFWRGVNEGNGVDEVDGTEMCICGRMPRLECNCGQRFFQT